MADAPQVTRPLSPHLQIWRWSPSMAASIMHRATGIALYAGAILLAVWMFAAAVGPEAYTPVAAVVGSPFGLVMLFGFCWALLFHAFNGMRHLYWDSGRGLAPRTAKLTSLFIFAAAFVITIVIFVAAMTGGSQ